jgi:hypothetical protein
MCEYSSVTHLDSGQTPSGNKTHVVDATPKGPVSFLVYFVLFYLICVCSLNSTHLKIVNVHYNQNVEIHYIYLRIVFIYVCMFSGIRL